MVYFYPVYFSNLLDDKSFHHLCTIQAKASIIHCEENSMCFILGWRVNLQKQNTFNEPIDKERQSFTFQIIREVFLDVIVPVKHILSAFVIGNKGIVSVIERKHAFFPFRYINIECLLSKVDIINKIVHLDQIV